MNGMVFLDLNDELKEYQFQYMWSRMPKDSVLSSVDGVSIRVVTPGVWNKEEGPDFKNAVINIDGFIKKGDVELHLVSDAWEKHGHQNDKNYSNVILHVVRQYCGGKSEDKAYLKIPTVELSGGIISQFTAKNKGKYPQGRCVGFFNNLSDAKVKSIFNSAGVERLRNRGEKVVNSILRDGINTAFLMGIFDSLGYKKNRQQFSTLLERIFEYDLDSLNRGEISSILWGESGFLPDPTQFTAIDDSISAFIESNWGIWWKLRNRNRERIEWNLSGVRPQNNPCRRIAAAEILLFRFGFQNCFSFILDKFQKLEAGNSSWTIFRNYLLCHDDLWDGYCNFNSKLSVDAAVLGENRALDVMVNVVLPLIYGYSLINDISLLKERVINVFLGLPSGQNNIIIEMSAERWSISKERVSKIVKGMAAQQGIIYLFKNYCEKLSLDCSKCDLFNGSA
jgi:hypothetical protein